MGRFDGGSDVDDGSDAHDDGRSGTGADDGSGTDADRASGADAGGDEPRCPVCAAPLFGRHCKYVCPQHGVVVDCSDPFL